MITIELNRLGKEFDGIQALCGVDLAVKRGEVFGFLRPNGAGKSTIISILLDFVRPTAGSATVLGYDTQDESKAIRERTGVMPERYQVYNRLTGRHHIEFVIDSKDTPDDPVDVLERVGIGDAADRPADDYSKGMKQRLTVLAREIRRTSSTLNTPVIPRVFSELVGRGATTDTFGFNG